MCRHSILLFYNFRGYPLCKITMVYNKMKKNRKERSFFSMKRILYLGCKEDTNYNR